MSKGNIKKAVATPQKHATATNQKKKGSPIITWAKVKNNEKK
jgi:hypothetical protein